MVRTTWCLYFYVLLGVSKWFYFFLYLPENLKQQGRSVVTVTAETHRTTRWAIRRSLSSKTTLCPSLSTPSPDVLLQYLSLTPIRVNPCNHGPWTSSSVPLYQLFSFIMHISLCPNHNMVRSVFSWIKLFQLDLAERFLPRQTKNPLLLHIDETCRSRAHTHKARGVSAAYSPHQPGAYCESQLWSWSNLCRFVSLISFCRSKCILST